MKQRKKVGSSAYLLENPVAVVSASSVVGPEEGAGALGEAFDYVSNDDYFGQKTWEQAESAMISRAVGILYEKSELTPIDTGAFFGGDLEKQCTGTSFGFRGWEFPFCGLYGACSTFAEGMALGAAMIDGGYMAVSAAAASSHFSAAEREYRMPLAYGNQRQLCAQRTVTGCGAVLLSGQLPTERHVAVTGFAFGKMVDAGVTDPAEMGAAMAPAAYQTITTYLEDRGMASTDYHRIYTGDLGEVGYTILRDMTGFGREYEDCGRLVFTPDQDTHAGGSGCGCSATVFGAYILPDMLKHPGSRVLLAGTGALLSATSVLQGESIPGICHLVELECREGVKSC
ncbi:MAG: stage V sporulation protein AD [Clostridia bacterium]|nr:stage V sporulation protein AD [Clostridia bacterium]